MKKYEKQMMRLQVSTTIATVLCGVFGFMSLIDKSIIIDAPQVEALVGGVGATATTAINISLIATVLFPVLLLFTVLLYMSPKRKK